MEIFNHCDKCWKLVHDSKLLLFHPKFWGLSRKIEGGLFCLPCCKLIAAELKK